MTKMNGVDVDGLKEVVQAVGDRPELAHVTFGVSSDWAGGMTTSSCTAPFRQAGEVEPTRTATYSFASDEPAALLGTDAAASPGEYVLQALAGCYAVTFAANAAARGIQLDSLHFELEGDFDLHGFLGLDEKVRPGMGALRVRVALESPNASREELEDLTQTVEARSPIRDTLAAPVPVETILQQD
ncbi:MAG: OsmC family protein [Thermoleophilaceae bacterium]